MTPSVLPVAYQRFFEKLIFLNIRNRVFNISGIAETNLLVPFHRPHPVFNFKWVYFSHIERQFRQTQRDGRITRILGVTQVYRQVERRIFKLT